MLQFIADSGRENHSFEQGGQNVDVPDQDQVVDWPCIGYNRRHFSES